jgi:hypothetical protein
MKSFMLSAAALALALSPGAARAEKRAELEAQFKKLKDYNQKALQGSPEAVKNLKDGAKFFNRDKFNPVPDDPKPPTGLGVKVWAELTEGPNAGKLVHPEKYKWHPKERFYLWFETSSPVYVALYQNYQEQPTRKVLPDEKYPLSYSAVLPGQPYRFPIKLEMDDNLHKELMSIVLVAGTSPDININQNKPQVLVMNPGDNQPVLDKGAKMKFAEGMDKAYKDMHGKPNAKFNPSTQDDQQNPSIRPVSDRPDDVAVICIGRENSGYVQLTLFK